MQKMKSESLADLVNMAANLGLGRGRSASGASPALSPDSKRVDC
jgi:hypothetical protein